MSRKLNWISALDNRFSEDLNELQKRMQDFYRSSSSYYVNIDFNHNIWTDQSQYPQLDIIKEIRQRSKILEIGCGKANILKAYPEIEDRYTGIEFSEELIEENRRTYPKATFKYIKEPNKFPVDNASADVVFSHFVLEHCVYPHLFLNECNRVLKTNGTFVLLCPEFLNKNYIPSQQIGFSQGPTKLKLKRGLLLDAIITFIDDKIRLRLALLKCRNLARKTPQFYINLDPTCFYQPFVPDVDAVYLAFEEEIINYCNDFFDWETIPSKIAHFCQKRNLVYVKAVKR